MNEFKLKFLDYVQFWGGMALLVKSICKDLFKLPLSWKNISEQIYQIGVKSTPLVLITGLSTGMVMALQFGLGLEKFGGKLYVPKLVATTVLREMGPVFTSLMLAARVGAGIASEIGSMVVTQQIDAIRALGTSPIQKIVIPRVIGLLVCLPILVAITNVVGNIGGLAVGTTELGLDSQYYIIKIFQTVSLYDYFSGFGKSFFFALFIAIPACYFGMNVQNGTKEVGIATTKAVVTSSIMILVGDFFLTKFFWMLQKW
ncbi:MAG: MlaE family ABC transporter permease [Pseudobdellovibrionaceae bacterium]|jgi:phospholipid/cholesterol/gamma-HCH transport system permease protein